MAGTVYNVGRVFYAKGYYTGNPHKGLWGCTFFRPATGSEGACPVLRVCAVRVWLCVLCVAAGRWTWGCRTDTSECARIHLVCLATVSALAVFFCCLWTVSLALYLHTVYGLFYLLGASVFTAYKAFTA